MILRIFGSPPARPRPCCHALAAGALRTRATSAQAEHAHSIHLETINLVTWPLATDAVFFRLVEP